MNLIVSIPQLESKDGVVNLAICQKHLYEPENRHFLGHLHGASLESCYFCRPEWYAKLVKGLRSQLWLNEIGNADWVYISGPMSGLPDHNVEAFHLMEAILLQHNCRVLSPAKYAPGEERLSYSQFMRRDIRMVCEANKIVMLKGYEKSKGANLELSIAQIIGTTIFYECD